MKDYKKEMKQRKKFQRYSAEKKTPNKGVISWRNTQFDSGYVGKFIFSHSKSSIKGDIKVLY